MVYVTNFLGHDHSVIRSDRPVGVGSVVCDVSWTKTAEFAGEVVLCLNGEIVGQGEVARTNPVLYSVAEGLEIGSDSATPVWAGYRSPATFTGTIKSVTINTKGDEYVDLEAEDRIARYVQ